MFQLISIPVFVTSAATSIDVCTWLYVVITIDGLHTGTEQTENRTGRYVCNVAQEVVRTSNVQRHRFALLSRDTNGTDHDRVGSFEKRGYQ